MVLDLRRLVDRESINVIIPTLSVELPVLAAARAGFGPDVRIIVGEPAAVALANDHLFTAWALQAAGIPVPRFGVPGDLAAAPASLAGLNGPVVVKPRVFKGTRAVHLLAGTGSVNWQLMPAGQLVQEFIPGADFVVLVFGTPARNAMAPVAVVLEKTKTPYGRVGSDEVSRRVPAGEAGDVRKLGLAAVRTLGLTGPVQVQIRRRADGTPVVLGVCATLGENSKWAPELLDAVLATFMLPSFNPASFRRCPAVPAAALG
jgi:carbamoyl-phosphate synthase large subunit